MTTPTNKPAYVTLHRLGELSGRSRNTLLLRMRDAELLADATLVGGDKEQAEALSADDKQRQLTTFLFIQSQPLDVVKKAVKLARENRQAFEDEYLLPFELELPVTAMFTAMQQLEQNLTAIEAAQIEVITRPSGSKKEPTPPPN